MRALLSIFTRTVLMADGVLPALCIISGDSRTLSLPEPCTPTPPVPEGRMAPCPTHGFITGCQIKCSDSGSDPSKSGGCVECYPSAPSKPLITDTAVECQAACAADSQCHEFAWIGIGNDVAPTLHHQCLFKCSGAVAANRTDCSVGHTMGHAGGAWVCGPKHNATGPPPPPPPPLPPPPPSPPGSLCPIPLGLTGGVVEEGTDHARAPSGTHTGMPRHDLTCKPWCLFNLTSDIGERDDLGQNPAFQGIARKIAARLKYHGSTGPLPAWIWPVDEWDEKVDEMCEASVATGFLEPLDATGARPNPHSGLIQLP